MEISKLDFVAVPSTDAERSRGFYVNTLGLRPDEHAEYECWAGQTCLGIWEPAKFGMEFAPQKNGHIVVTLKAGIEEYADLSPLLVESGHKIRLFREEEVNLESAFMALTRGLGKTI